MEDKITEVVSLAPVPGWIYLLFVEYESGEGGNAPGQVFRIAGPEGTELVQVLNSNDTLRRLWASPSGHIWASSEDGNVYTTAPVTWPAPTQPDLDVQSLLPDLSFKVTTLPPAPGQRRAPSLGVLWGTGDSDVFVAAGGGGIHHWDGKAWSHSGTAPGEIRAFGGTSPDDVYAVGQRGALLHFDGKTWTPLQAPPGPAADAHWTGCATAPDGSVVISGMDGFVLHGSRAGLTVLGHDDERQFVGVGMLGQRVLLAARQDGCVELSAQGFAKLPKDFHSAEIIPDGARAFFIAVDEGPAYVMYDPADPLGDWAIIDV